jgi:hypothetical protein
MLFLIFGLIAGAQGFRISGGVGSVGPVNNFCGPNGCPQTIIDPPPPGLNLPPPGVNPPPGCKHVQPIQIYLFAKEPVNLSLKISKASEGSGESTAPEGSPASGRSTASDELTATILSEGLTKTVKPGERLRLIV